jgi:hypothetical protein
VGGKVGRIADRGSKIEARRSRLEDRAWAVDLLLRDLRPSMLDFRSPRHALHAANLSLKIRAAHGDHD